MEQMRNEIKIVLTGGHAATTALAVVQEIRLRSLNWKIYFAGATSAIEGKKTKTFESEVLPKHDVIFLPLITGRVQRKFTIWTIPSILKIPVGIFQAVYYLIKIRPSVVLSFGGFASVPIVIAAKMLGIPIIIHEQTAAAGRANLFAAKFASIIALAREESIKYFPSSKTVITGNPVLTEITSIKSKVESNQKTIFITGGSRGSQSINTVLGIILPKLLIKYNVIHQTGELDFKKFETVKKSLPKNIGAKYTVFARVDPWAIAKMFQQSDLVVARAGANTVSDILAANKPSILIPLPISYLDEQTKNAKYAQKFGNSELINQSELSPSVLITKIETFFSNPKLQKTQKMANPDLSAAEKIVDLLDSYIN